MFSNESGKISPKAALIVFILGIVAIAGAAVLLIVRPGMNKGNNTVQADVIPFAARVDKLDGDVGIARQTEQGDSDLSYQGWTKATVNAPVSLGDRIYSSNGSKAAIEINRNNYVRLNSNTSLDVVSLSEGNTQLALREGACVFDVGALDSGETYEIATPNGAVDFAQPGLYQVGIDDEGGTVVSVLNGVAQVAGLDGSCEVSKGQFLTLAAADAAEAIVSDLSADVAGPIVDDYYSYRYQDDYDGRYSDYQAYASDPNYYQQSYRSSASYQYIPEDAEIAGVEDLNDYGDWQDVPDYGRCWSPRTTSSDWAPYRDGYWSDDHTLGLTWVSNERWGWAPYHYGRWAHVNQQWYWVPAEIKRHAVYAPALVAFVSPQADEVGWVPLGPGDAYVPRYYDRNYQPRYAGSRSEIDRYVNVTNIRNYNDASAVTIVSISQFTRVITPATVLRPGREWRANARPIADPYAVPYVRQIARTLDSSRPVVEVPLESQRRFNRRVMMRQQPTGPSDATNVAKALNVEAVPEKAVKQKLRVKNLGQAVTTTQANGIPSVPPEAKVTEAKVNRETTQERDARTAALASQAAQGNKAAKREMRQLEAQQQAQQQQDAKAAKAERKAAAQQAATQQQQQGNPQKAQKQAARQQAQQAAEQNKQQAEQQRQAQKQAARQQTQQAAQQSEQQRQAQSAQQKAQKQAQKQAAQQQAQQAAEQNKQQAAQQRQAQKQAARQQAQQAAEQNKQQAAQQRQAQAAQQVNPQKAQKQAARQQAQQEAQQAAQKQAQREAARQQAQQEQKRLQKQAQQQAAQQQQQQAQQQKQQQKQQRRTEAPPEAPKAQPSAAQTNPAKAEKRAEKAKNKNSGQ